MRAMLGEGWFRLMKQNATVRWAWLGGPAAALLGVMLCCAGARGQQAGALPEAPAPTNGLQEKVAQGPESRSVGTIRGVVNDVGGTAVEGAHVTLVTSGALERDTVTDSAGRFVFSDVVPGGFALLIREEGLAPDSITGKMRAGEEVEMPPIDLRVATVSDSVEVTITQQELAEDEIKQQEKQRVVGIVPNFFVSYNWKAKPLTVKQKFELGWHSTLDPTHFIFSAIGAGVEQANNDFPGFGPGWQGYGKRYGASLADSTTAVLLRGSIMPSLFHQDPRYFYKGTGSVWSRAVYALSTAVRSRGDNGHWEVSAGIAADFASGAISNLYYASSDRHGAALTFENGAFATVGVGVGHLVQEFVFKHITPGVRKVPVVQP